MNKEIDFETYLIISYGKFEIFLLDVKNHKDIYQEEFKFRDVSEKLDLNLLNDPAGDPSCDRYWRSFQKNWRCLHLFFCKAWPI